MTKCENMWKARYGLGTWIVLGLLMVLTLSVLAEDVLIEFGSSMVYKANQSDPGIGLNWTAENFDDSAWTSGTYGVGYGAGSLIQTTVPSNGTYSVYTRARFMIADINDVTNLFLGADYCDGYVAWINGVEVIRRGVPSETLWNSNATSHESSNGPSPNYNPFNDISSVGLPALHNGENVLAVGVWNSSPSSSDLVVVPKLSMNFMPTLTSRGPYLQMATPTSIVLRWRTASATDSRVSYGDAPGSLDSIVESSNQTTEHEIELIDLSPNTQYYYSVGSTTEIFAGGDSDHFFITPPPTGGAQPTRIWVLGDSGKANSNAAAVRDAYYAFNGTAYTNLWLMLGDNAYPDGTDSEYQAALFDIYPEILRQSPLWSTLGNHDGHSAHSATQTGPYYSIFTLPKNGEAGGVNSGTEAYYSFNYGNIHFVCLDSYDTDRAIGGAMHNWLGMDLATNTSDWLIAFWHHPPYSKGSHDSDSETRLREMRENFLPLLESHGVDLVLSGHSHGYERSFLLNGHYGHSTTFLESHKIDNGDGRLDGTGAYTKDPPGSNDGAVYVVAGASSQVSNGTYNHPAMYLSIGILGSVVLDIDENILDLKYLDDAGVVQDYFTIVKGDPGPLPPVANDDTYCTNQNDVLNVTAPGVLSNDVDPNSDPITSTLVSATTSGTVALSIDGSFTYTPDFDFSGIDSFTYVANDGNDDSNEATVNITVNPIGATDLYPTSDIPVAGTVSGSFANLLVSDNTYESIQERESGGKPSNRHSFLEHKWVFDVPDSGCNHTATFFVEAHHSSNFEADDFQFAYSTDNTNFTDMLLVTKVTDDDSQQSYTLPPNLSGIVYIQVVDADQTPGNNALDTIFIDRMFIRTEATGGETPPGQASNPLPIHSATDVSTTVNLSWTKGSGATSHDVYFGTTSPGIFQGNQAENNTSFNPGPLAFATTYYWTINEVNQFGTTSGQTWSFTTESEVTNDIIHVQSILLGIIPVGGPNNRGIATVSVVNSNNEPVDNATVFGLFSGSFNESITGVTDTNGQVTLTTAKKSRLPIDFQFCVENVTHSLDTYNPNHNVITCDNYPPLP